MKGPKLWFCDLVREQLSPIETELIAFKKEVSAIDDKLGHIAEVLADLFEIVDDLNAQLTMGDPLPPSESKPEFPQPAPRQREESKWTLADQHPYFINEWCEFFLPLQQRILALDDSVSENVNKNYVAYKKNGKGLVRIYGGRGKREAFGLMLPVNPLEINDPWMVCTEISEEEARTYGRTHWKTHVGISTTIIGWRNRKYIYNESICNRVEDLNPPRESSLDYLMQLIRQVFETL